MWNDILHGFTGNLTPLTLLVIVLGTMFGAISGAIPGISAITAMALVLPFTFGLEPAQGLVLLGAVYMSSEFGGAIPAILFGTPGGSGAACTMLDGYPMTKKGQAEDALYLQLFAGTIGGAVGVLLLLFFTPALAAMAQELGPPELFWATVAGLAFVATLVGRNIIGGFIAVAIGVLLTIPGQDSTTGQLRFTFDSPDMVGGLNIVPVMLGLFAIASVLLMLELPDDAVAPLNRRPGVIKYVLSRMWGMKYILSWTSFVGAAVGLVPGAGASASAFAAYGEAKRWSKHPEEFGKGAWEGVAAPEAANNAVVGGSLVSLLGIGIPASPTAAILFGALTVQGLVPGPMLFTDHADVAYKFITGLFLTVVTMVIFGLMTVRYSAMICRVPVRYVVPSVLALTMIGAFAMRNNPFDVIVAAITGLIAFILMKVGISWIPLALGLVLGQIMEQRLQQSLLIAPTRGGLFHYWFTRPVTLVLMAVVAILLISGIWQLIKVRRLPIDETEAVVEDKARWISARTAGLTLGIGVLALAAFLYFGSSDWLPRARQLPIVLSVLLAVLALAMILLNLRPRPAERTPAPPFAGVPWGKWLILAVGILIVAFTQNSLGLLATLAVYMVVVTIVLTDRDKPKLQTVWRAVACSAVMTTGIYVVFEILLEVPLPHGIFS